MRLSDHINLAAFAAEVQRNDPPAPLWYAWFVYITVGIASVATALFLLFVVIMLFV